MIDLRNDSLDVVLGPDPGPVNGHGDNHFTALHRTDRFRSTKQMQEMLDAAHDRHVRDMRRRYHLTEDWHAKDFSVRDLAPEPWTRRQLLVALWVEIACLLAVIVGLVAGSTPILAAAIAAVAVMVPLLVRDCWRRLSGWMGEFR